jgi:hypothetical protein
VVGGKEMKDEDIWSVFSDYESYKDIFFKALLLDKIKIVPKLNKDKVYYQIVVDKIEEEE